MFDTALAPGALALLQQGYRNNWQQYLAALTDDAHRPHWDLCVLTASNARQADAYQAQLQARREAGLLPAGTQFEVLADPDGLRIGSGGATLRVLAELARQAPAPAALNGQPLAGKRVLVIHSGGDSRRLPHCSAIGKLFARVPHALPDGRCSSLFDEFLVSLSGLPGQTPPGVLVASGDVLLLFDHLQLGLTRPGITGVAAAAPAETGTQHGVYVTAGATRQVRSFLHKPSVERMCAEGALLADGSVQVDTGLVWLDRTAVERMLALAAELSMAVAQGVTVNLYGDLLAPLAQTAELGHYLTDASDGPATPRLQEVRQRVWATLRGLPFSVERLNPAVFIHFGTTREYLHVLADGVHTFQACGWQPRAGSWVSPTASTAGERLVAMNACVHDGTNLAGAVLDAQLHTHLTLGEECLLANVLTERPTLELKPGMGLHQVPLRAAAGYVTRLFGVEDDPKCALAEGGTFLNRPWSAWLAAARCSAQDLWPAAQDVSACTLWEAQLYPICPTREESLDLVLWMQSPEQADEDTLRRWRMARRLSLAESYVQADVQRLVQEQGEIEDHVRAQHFFEGLTLERPASELGTWLGGARDAGRRARLVADQIEASIDPWLPMRGYHALFTSTREGRWEERAFSALARLVRAHTSSSAGLRVAGGVYLQNASVRAAARIDFGGGWSDTPPYSLECGGTVLNAALSLWEQHPILAEVKLLDEPTLVLGSGDIEATLRPRFAGEILNYANPADPFALLKAALVLRGLVPADTPAQANVSDLLRPFGCGLHVATQTTIPRGSGLGTSSILAGALLQCLAAMLGQALEQDQLFDEVLCVEQMITTGGGWQDQIGGLMGGIKLTTTPPGLPQRFTIDRVPLTPTLRRALDERLCLVYTGQRRLAKDLLRAIMGRFMARAPEMVAMLRDIAHLAVAMRQALGNEDLDAFGDLIAQHWEINKRMDPGCTNPFINDLLELCRPYMVGAKLAGAGGGGFAIVIARDAAATQALDAALQAHFPQGGVALWPCRVAEEGLI